MTRKEAAELMVQYALESAKLDKEFHTEIERHRRWDNQHLVDFNLYRRARKLEMKANKLRMRYNIPCMTKFVQVAESEKPVWILCPVDYILTAE